MTLWPAAGSRPVVSVSRTIWRIYGECALEGRRNAARILPDPPPKSTREHRIEALVRELVGTLVFRMPRVPLDPMPRHLVALRGGGERLPEILILDRLLVRRLPAARPPRRQPLRDAAAHV